MHILKRVLIILGVLVFGLVVFATIFVQTLKPKYSGDLAISGLQEPVEVKYDSYGIPHIYARNETDLYLALGYVHAQDRLWQMELMRRITPGRLSEIFGEDLVETDKFFRTLGIHQYSAKSAARLRQSNNPEVLVAAEAYLMGVNGFMDAGPTPIEFHILGIEKEHYTLEDIYNVVGYMSFSFALGYKTDALNSSVAKELGPEYLVDLSLGVSPNSTRIPNYEEPPADTEIELAKLISKVTRSLPAPAWIGSNSWVVAPKKSKTGNSILVNDPHIEFSQPSVWYEAHLISPGFELYGYHLALVPFAVLAHNRHLANGFTMFENDDMDLYYEEIHVDDSSRYIHSGQTHTFGLREETIRVKGSDDVKMTVRSTLHGPIVTDILEGLDTHRPVSLWWTLFEFENNLLEASFGMAHAGNIDETRNAASLIHAPGLNMMYADKAGNIAWWAIAKLPVRPDHVNSKTILDGSSGRDEVLGYMEFSQNPQAQNPPWDFVYSANNQPDSVYNQLFTHGGSLYPGYYVPEDRGKRIEQLIQEGEEFGIEDMKKMLMDDVSTVLITTTNALVSLVEAKNEVETNILEILRSWDGSHDPSASAPLIYQKWVNYTMDLAMVDELGEDRMEIFRTTHQYKRMIADFIMNDSSIWWDDLKTEQKESRREIANRSFNLMKSDLKSDFGDNPNEWHWGDAHVLRHPHALGSVKPLDRLLSIGPFKVGSSVEVINNQGFIMRGSGHYPVVFGPSTRRIVNFADINESWSILPTGQSGNPFSPHYDDQAEMFVKGEYRKMLMDEGEIRKAAKNTLTLTPHSPQ